MTGEIRPIGELRFLVVGAYVLDCLISTPQLPRWGVDLRAEAMRTVPGGKALNQAVTLARLGTQVGAIGVVGSDVVGSAIRATLAAEGIDVTTMTTTTEAPTPVCVVFGRDDGEKSVVWRVPDELAVTGDHVRDIAEQVANSDAVVLTFEFVEHVADIVSIAKKHGTRVVVNPAPLSTDPVAVARIPWDEVDLLVPNESEARALLGDRTAPGIPAHELADSLADALGVPFVCVTLAERGCVVRADGITTTYPAPPAEAVDSTGASDAFAAILTAYIVAGHHHSAAVHQAQHAAALTVTRHGAFDALPTARELQEQTHSLPKPAY